MAYNDSLFFSDKIYIPNLEFSDGIDRGCERCALLRDSVERAS